MYEFLATLRFIQLRCHCLTVSSVAGAPPLPCNSLDLPSNSAFLFFPRHRGKSVESFHKAIEIERPLLFQYVKDFG